jgi:hypothetical protein
MTNNLDRIACITDDLESLAAGLNIPMSASFHVDQLRKILPENVQELKDAIVDETGENPWE